ncbi:unnamed protein product [Periconia digitata]|uniref:DNA 3'-5' helicase n=1 Tax=Periconia digitata TaxID=1303443 RepID=A0A9W4XNU3_9PLEO|nr:unnamed protein product [Periconia digitata]
MPPKNNLNAQIKWLLAEKPFIPPAQPIVAYDTNAPESSATGLITASQLTLSQGILEFEPNNAPVPAPAPPVTLPGIATTRSASYTVDIHKPIPSQIADPDMARLRATPGSGRPRLMLAGGQSYNSVPTLSLRTQVSGNATPTTTQRAAHTRQAEPDEVESIDLTSPPSSIKGKKRKSEEFEQDWQQRVPPRSAKALIPANGTGGIEDFAHIDDLATVPESPPPPYSTTLPVSRLAQSRQPESATINDEDEDHHHLFSDEDSLMLDAEAEATPSNRKRKSLSRAPSEIPAPARKIGKHDRSPSPRKVLGIKVENASNGTQPSQSYQRRNRVAVMDSEDDEDGVFDQVHVNPKFEPVSSHRPPSTRAQTPQEIAERNATTVQSPPKLLARSTVSRNNTTSLVTRDASASPGKLHRSSQKLQSTPSSTLVKLPSAPLASELSKEKKDLMRRTVEAFFDSDGFRLKNHLDAATSSWSKLKIALMEQLESGADSSDINDRVKRAHAKKTALDKIITTKATYETLVAKRQEIRTKIDVGLNTDGEFDPADGEALKEVFKKLEEMNINVYHLLEPAGMNKYLESPVPVPGSSNEHTGIIVKSTQAPSVTHKQKDMQASGSGHVPQTQYSKRNNPPAGDLWTPRHQIRFADEPDVESPPPKVSWATKAQEQAPVSKGTLESRSHRIPETPRRERIRATPAIHNEDGFGFDFDEPDSRIFNTTTMGPAPDRNEIDMEDYSLGGDEENFLGEDDDDDDALIEMSNIPNRPAGAYDWKGDWVDSQSHLSSRHALKETSNNPVSQRNHPQSPKKPHLNMPGMQHPWSRDVRDMLLHRFHLRGFRPGQLDAINTTLGGEHCFVLMPTGGGKSLCYQLPSVVNSGKTKGVTIVVSPLLSLMEDQVTACKERFHMQAFLINGESTAAEKNLIMDGLREREPEKFIQLLYVTPEMLGKNQRMISALEQLHQRNRLARIVIDEAHCVSQWGHDFRPDYKLLGDVIHRFSGVPILALTATATPLVRTDVMANLGIRGGRLFSQSFNRPNLSYEVKAKAKGIVDNIAELIKARYPGKSGIVYCLSRKNCESVAKKLTELGIKAYHYHAGMASAERSDVQIKWQSNEYNVIVATIAFGMGIDKADVRFVMHHTIPKSLEGYYQETGRAGRDGKRSECYLYYQYADTISLKKMIEDGDGNMEQKQRQRDMLRQVVQFCENRSDCRRAQVLGYFDERFNREDCNNTCDNCKSDATFVEKDLSEYAAAAIRLVKQVESSEVTLLQCVDAFRGAKNAKLKGANLGDCYGFGQGLERENVERVFTHLIEAQALRHESKSNKAGWAISYIRLGPKAYDYERRKKQFTMQIRVTPRKPQTKAPKKKGVKARAEYPSTNVSSPIRPVVKRNIRDYAYSLPREDDDDDDYYEDASRASRTNRQRARGVNKDEDVDDYGFAPIRVAKTSGATTRTSKKPRGPPITVDQRIAGLSDVQKDVLEHFMTEAKKITNQLKMNKPMRYAPFSDMVLREMGLDLPEDENAMLALPQIKPEMVKLFGKPFLDLIAKIKNFYEGTGGAPQPSQVLYDNDDDDDGLVMDPNHENVIDLCDDSEEEGGTEGAAVGDDNSTSYSDSDIDNFDDDDDGEEQVSHFFKGSVDPSVESFNNRYVQLESQRPNPKPKPPAGASLRGAGSSSTSTKPPFKKKKTWRKKGSTGYSRSGGSGGVKKATARKSGGNVGSSKKASTSTTGRGGGGIAAMPT